MFSRLITLVAVELLRVDDVGIFCVVRGDLLSGRTTQRLMIPRIPAA